ncbi:MAG: ABC transporter permease subunit [Deltaproteobacteria bacterium]|nr:ABC transporter permease subunit [Deltaproteobacteria bacterium]
MRHVGAIAGRELRSIFSTPVAYVMFSVYLVFSGFAFFLSLTGFLSALQQIQAFQRFDLLEQFNLNTSVIEPSLGIFSFVFLLLIPLLTMRAFAEEQATGTIELLLTSPLTIWEIVLGKYLAILAVIGMLVGLSGLYPALLFYYGDPELLPTLAGLMGLFLYGAAFAAIGCLISSLTRSQISAALVTFFAGMILYLIDYFAELSLQGTSQQVVRYLGLRVHFDELVSGVVKTDDLVYFAVVVVFFVSGVRAATESLRWR